MEHIIKFDLSAMPTTLYADHGYCRKPMLHVDRIANHDILLFVLSGCIPIFEAGHEYILEPGDIFFLKNKTHHWGESFIPEGTSWYFIHFRHTTSTTDVPEFSADFRHTPNVHCLEENYRQVITLPKHLRNMRNTDIEDKTRKLIELFNSNKPFQMAYVNSCLHQLLVDLYIFSQSIEKTDSTSARIQRICNFFAENINKPFTPTEIETHMGLSFKHIGKIFKEQTGMTLHQYHTKMKMERATRLLCSTNKTITEISEALGYSNPLYFSNVFKKYSGMSPRAYRNKYSAIL